MALSSWVGPARDMAYNPDDWQPAERTLTVEGWVVRLEGSHDVPANTVTFTGSTLKRIHLLVVPPGTPGGVARAALRAAAGSDTTATIEEILSSNGLSRGEGPHAEPCR
ncbi:DUF5994 family protein, partial [Kibdelosporangium lantanae]